MLDAVARERIDVDCVYGLHYDPMTISALRADLAKCAWLLIRRESHESAGPERIAEVPSRELLRRAYEAD
jgi:hypothetical protein